MPNVIKPLARTTLTTTTSTTLYTVPSVTTTVITSIVVSNITSSAATVTLSLNDVAILSGVSIPANSASVIDLKQALTADQTIKGGAGTGSALTIHITGVEIT
jgi:hypothetical protein